MVPRSPFALLRLLPLACLALFPAWAARAGLDTDFVKANSAYEAGNYAEAEKLYRTLADAGAISEDLFYNLGNTAYRQDRPGEAALWFKRTLYLNPRMAEARQNLKVLQKRIGYLEFTVTGFDLWLSKMTRAELAALTWIAVWTALILLAAAFALPRLRDWRPLIYIVASISLAFAVAARWAEHRYQANLSPESLAIVTAPEIKAVVSPVPGADPVVELPPGSEVRLLLDRGQWQFVAIPDDLRGWVRTEHLGRVVEAGNERDSRS